MYTAYSAVKDKALQITHYTLQFYLKLYSIYSCSTRTHSSTAS